MECTSYKAFNCCNIANSIGMVPLNALEDSALSTNNNHYKATKQTNSKRSMSYKLVRRCNIVKSVGMVPFK